MRTVVVRMPKGLGLEILVKYPQLSPMPLVPSDGNTGPNGYPREMAPARKEQTTDARVAERSKR